MPASGSDDPPVDGGGDRSRPGVYAELAVDVGQVGLHGGLGDEQLTGHLLVAESSGEELEDLHLALGDGDVGARGTADERGRYGGRQHGFTAISGPDGREQLVGRRVLEQIAPSTRVESPDDV